MNIGQQVRERVRYSVNLIRIGHADGSVTRVNTGFRNIDWDDGSGEGEQVWTGVGLVVSLDLPDQSDAIEVSEFSVRLSGLSSDYRSLSNEVVRGQPITVTLGFIGPDGRIAASEPVEVGVQDRVEWVEGEGMRNELNLHCLSGLTFLSNQSVPRWSPEPHAAYLSGLGIDPDSDTGFDDQHGIPDDARQAAWWPPQ